MARRSSLILMAMAAGLLPSPALPALVVAHFTGVISEGIDGNGTFVGTGNAGLDLTTVDSGLGTPYISGTFSYDTEAAPLISPGYYDNLGLDLNWLGASVTIAGTSYTFGGIQADDGGNPQNIFFTDDPDSFFFSIGRYGADGLEGISIELPDEDFLSGPVLPTAFTYQSATGGTGNVVIQAGNHNLNATFSITCASTDPTVCTIPGDGGTSAVPEPATWASLGLGFALVGAGMRRLRRRGPGHHNKSGRHIAKLT